MKILQIVENLDKGAVENWLVNMFIESRNIKPDWEWTFYCILGREGRLDNLVKNAGGKIIYSNVAVNDKIAFLIQLRKVLKQGKYDIIHVHHDYLSGFYLLSSMGIRFKKRLLHIHNTDKALPVANKRLHNFLLKPFYLSGKYFSDVVVGISNNTLEEFVGQVNKKKHTVLYYGIDMSSFEKKQDIAEKKAQWNIPENAKCILFVGRMTELKNPVFVVEILNELLRSRKDVYAIFIGKGHLESEVISRAKSLGIENNIRLTGWSDDIAVAMKAADVFVFPRLESPKEGLGLVVVEAQAAGLPTLVSNGIVPDAVEINELVHFIRLNNNPEVWAACIQNILNTSPAISRSEALQKMKQSKFELHHAAQNLLALYN